MAEMERKMTKYKYVCGDYRMFSCAKPCELRFDESMPNPDYPTFCPFDGDEIIVWVEVLPKQTKVKGKRKR
jgi:hypothetical protein